MTHFTDSGTPVPPNSAPSNADGGRSREPLRHLLFGSLAAVQLNIKSFHKMGYAEPNDWSKPIPTGRSGEVMAILVKYLWVD
jgi:hypothetical protein